MTLSRSLRVRSVAAMQFRTRDRAKVRAKLAQRLPLFSVVDAGGLPASARPRVRFQMVTSRMGAGCCFMTAEMTSHKADPASPHQLVTFTTHVERVICRKFGAVTLTVVEPALSGSNAAPPLPSVPER